MDEKRVMIKFYFCKNRLTIVAEATNTKQSLQKTYSANEDLAYINNTNIGNNPTDIYIYN